MSEQQFRENLNKLSEAFKQMYDPKYNTTHYNGYDFVCTCYACPEQYDVYKGDYTNGNKVAYVRKRWGHLAVHPVINDNIDWNTYLYEETEADAYNGVIDDRDKTFENIVNAINKLSKN